MKKIFEWKKGNEKKKKQFKPTENLKVLVK